MAYLIACPWPTSRRSPLAHARDHPQTAPCRLLTLYLAAASTFMVVQSTSTGQQHHKLSERATEMVSSKSLEGFFFIPIVPTMVPYQHYWWYGVQARDRIWTFSTTFS
jgi:hypothetical protein